MEDYQGEAATLESWAAERRCGKVEPRGKVSVRSFPNVASPAILRGYAACESPIDS